jgi:predicted RNase H-like nuclease
MIDYVKMRPALANKALRSTQQAFYIGLDHCAKIIRHHMLTNHNRFVHFLDAPPSSDADPDDVRDCLCALKTAMLLGCLSLVRKYNEQNVSV